MPVEIRELIIKTEVVTEMHHAPSLSENRDLSELKAELLAKCRRMIVEKTKRNNLRR